MTKGKVVGLVLAALMLFGSGFAVATWRHYSSIAGYDKREADRLEQIRQKEAEQNQLRGENSTIRIDNDKLRQEIAADKLEKQALDQFIKDHGLNIAAETRKLEQISEQLKTDTAVLSAPSDLCTRCRRFSATAVRDGTIRKPLSCTEECKGSPQ